MFFFQLTHVLVLGTSSRWVATHLEKGPGGSRPVAERSQVGRNRSQTTWRWAATHLHLRLHGSGQLITIGTWWQGRGIRGCPIGLVDPTFCFPSCSSVAPRAPTLSFGPAMDCHAPNVAIPGPMMNFGAEFRRGRQRGRKGKGTALHTVAPGPHACGVHRETPDGPNGTAQPRERLAPPPLSAPHSFCMRPTCVRG